MKFNKIFGLTLAVAFSGSAMAMEHELTGGVSGDITVSTVEGNDETIHRRTIDVSGGYDVSATDWLQFGAELNAAYGKTKYQPSVKTFGALVGPTFNIGDEMESAFFVTAKVGVQRAESDGDSITIGQGLAGFGKRIPIFANVTYKPTFEFLVNRYAETNFYNYTVKFINLSVIF